MKADLHLHSRCSDGFLIPAEVLAQAKAQGLDTIALTDHDSVGGIREILGADPAVRVIPGVEISSRSYGNIHLLCYGVRSGTPLWDEINRIRDMKAGRAHAIADVLRARGYDIADEDFDYHGACSAGRFQISLGMYRRGFTSSPTEALYTILHEFHSCYPKSERPTMEEILPIAAASGAIPVLAHPREIPGMPMEHLRPQLKEWMTMGLAGVEVYHPSAVGYTGALDNMARELGLLVTGGSDYHGDGDPQHTEPGGMCARWLRMEEDMDRLTRRLALPD